MIFFTLLIAIIILYQNINIKIRLFLKDERFCTSEFYLVRAIVLF